MIKILKASAGSGKTYSLAKEYLTLLLQAKDAFAYRHILAVTFTNKATDEMKQRILKELDILANEPEKSSYINDLVGACGCKPEEIAKSAGTLLSNILNDYGAFSVSTIDKFFQRALKAFSREIGQFASYQVELDKDSLVKESVDRLLDSLTDGDGTVLTWLKDGAIEQLNEKESFKFKDLVKELNEIAKDVRKDEYFDALKKFGIDENTFYSKENLKASRKACKEYVESFRSRVKEICQTIAKAVEDAGLTAADFSGGAKNGFMRRPLTSYAVMDATTEISGLATTHRANCLDPEKWFSKTNKSGRQMLPQLRGQLEQPLREFVQIFDDEFKIYNTANRIYSQFYALGLVRELNESFDELLREKNVVSLDDSNAILKGIIDGCDAPFIYEKLGVWYKNFLLDEFQDTSGVQWDNFRPLIQESNANGNGNLVVGDVKQSIYRWRGSDWNLLNSRINEDFPEATVSALASNWRSTKSIVEFNNAFYKYAAGILDDLSADGSDDNAGSQNRTISKIYGDVEQKAESKDVQCGNVDVLFVGKSDEVDSQIDAVISEINELLRRGARYSDIGILVRWNRDGAAVASALLQNDIPVISDDSMEVRMSAAVRNLVSLLSYVNNPKDRLNSFQASSLNIAPPEEYRSLVDLCEYFLRELERKGPLDGETMYIQSFMDLLQDWTNRNGNSLADFLEYWDGVNPKISSPQDIDAVRIMTIHKSKGLAFPYVIFPYSDGASLYDGRDTHWCHPDVKGTPVEDSCGGIYRLKLPKDGSADTLYADSYYHERDMQLVDAINTFYVATTRAEKGMTIISEKAKDDIKPEKVTKMSQSLYLYLTAGSSAETGFEQTLLPFDANTDANADAGDSAPSRGYEAVRYRHGVPYVFDHKNDETASIADESGSDGLLNGYPSYPLNPEIDGKVKNRLMFSADSSDFFSPDGEVGVHASARLRGIVLHDILSKVIVPEDLDSAVAEKLNDGSINAVEAGEIRAMLSSRISSAAERGWFPDDRGAVYNETSLIDADGSVYRPDRVVISGNKVTIVDYKFGHSEKKYADQISKYAQMYRSMGYQDVTASLWYVRDDGVETVG